MSLLSSSLVGGKGSPHLSVDKETQSPGGRFWDSVNRANGWENQI